MNSFSLFKMVDRRQWVFFLSSLSLPLLVQSSGRRGSFLPCMSEGKGWA